MNTRPASPIRCEGRRQYCRGQPRPSDGAAPPVGSLQSPPPSPWSSGGHRGARPSQPSTLNRAPNRFSWPSTCRDPAVGFQSSLTSSQSNHLHRPSPPPAARPSRSGRPGRKYQIPTTRPITISTRRRMGHLTHLLILWINECKPRLPMAYIQSEPRAQASGAEDQRFTHGRTQRWSAGALNIIHVGCHEPCDTGF